ncbi:hypothetical protein GQ53DRAFT_825020 [Thozetella sp. PMI_491]|nr:hypothetical protein GQ53DRAFT_825020 [Thozetella sp. PMI_491]
MSSERKLQYAPIDTEDDGSSCNGVDASEPFSNNDRKQTSRRRLPLLCILLCYGVLSTVTAILMVAHIASGFGKQGNACLGEGEYITTSFGLDNSKWGLMSTDPRYDYLWDEGHNDDVIPYFEDDDHHGEDGFGFITMFHQLHCIARIRKALQLAHQGVDPGVDSRSDAHWPHCLGYLRQSVLCWADGTIERRPRLPNGTIAGGIDGADDLRKCGNSRKLFKMARDHGLEIKIAEFP